VRDWRHGNQIFVGNNYDLKPKDSYLFHIVFDLNPTLKQKLASSFPDDAHRSLSLLVKNVQIPKYQIETKTMNAYNRASVVQQKIKYEPITITFHDDNSDAVRRFWFTYMNYYYRDSDYGLADGDKVNRYSKRTTYNNPTLNYWGYQPSNYADITGSEQLLDSIKIYSLQRKQFSEYVLINPKINSFQHGQHDQSKQEFMENTMSVSYESVIYNYGTVKTGTNPPGFATLNYDKGPSPLTAKGGGTTSILGPGGLVSDVTGIASSLSPPGNNPDGTPRTAGVLGFAGAGLTAIRGYNNLKGQNLLGMAGTELQSIATGFLNGDTNTLNRLKLPTPANPGSYSAQQGIQE
jgi:hypothetical protein